MKVRTIDVIALKKVIIESRLEKISDLSAASGVNRQTLGKILKGKSMPSSDVMVRLIDTLNMGPNIVWDIFFAKNLRNK